MRRKTYLRVLSPLVLVTLALLLTGCESALMDPKGQVGDEQRTLILTSFGLMQIVVIPVIVMTIAFAWRYRRSNRNATYSPDWHHSNKVEVVVWFVPCVIIAFLALLTWYTSHSLDPHKPLEAQEDGQEPLVIEAVSLDWKWLFIYPEQGIATVNELAFPEDTPVRFRVSSGSVMNSFFIPRLGSQIYAMAGMDNDLHLIADEQGVYPGRSTNYSGAGFSEMTFDAHVGSQEDFETWVTEVRESSETLTFPEEYYELAAPSEDNEIQYFSEVSPSLYESIIKSFHAGGDHEERVSKYADSYAEGFGHGGGHSDDSHGESAESHGTPMSAEAAE